MQLDAALLMFLTNEEINTLMKFYGTDLYEPYLKKLKAKYSSMLNWMDDHDW